MFQDTMVPLVHATRWMAVRLARAAGWLRALGGATPALVVSPSLEAAAGLSRAAAPEASFGWHRLTPGRLWATLAAPELARRGLVAVAGLSAAGEDAPFTGGGRRGGPRDLLSLPTQNRRSSRPMRSYWERNRCDGARHADACSRSRIGDGERNAA